MQTRPSHQTRTLRVTAATAAVMSLFASAPLQAQVNWGAGTGFWDVAGNWVGGVLPGVNDDVIINVGGLPTVTFRTITSTIRSLAVTNATFVVASGALTVSNNYSSNLVTTVSGGALTVGGTASMATLNVSGGTLTLGNASSLGTLNQTSGQVTGTGNLTVTGPATISFGAHTGSGTTTVQGATTISSSGLQLDGGRVFRNEGTVTQTSNVNLNANSFGTAQAGNGSVTNALGGTWNISGGSISASSQGGVDTGVGATFTNAGTFNKSGIGTTTVSVTFNSTGAIDVQQGTLSLSDGSALSGNINIASGATLSFSGGTHDITGGSVTSPGTFNISSGTVNVSTNYAIAGITSIGGGLLNLGSLATASTGTLNQTSGQVTGTGNLTVTGPATISFGAHTGSGTTTVQGATTISSSGLQLDGGRVFRNEGTVTQTGGVNLNANSFGTAQAGNGSVTNALGGTWNISGGSISASSQGGVDTGVGATFTNAGTFNKSGAGTTTVSVTFNNNGALNVQAGTLNFSDSFTHSGALTVASGATLSLSSGANTFNTSTTSIAGTLQLSSGTLQFTTPQTIGGTGTFQQSGGQVTSGDLTLASSLAATISFGAHTGGGTTTVQGATTISSSGLQLDGGRVFRNEGTVTQTGGVNLNANSFGTAQAGNGSVTNALGGTWNISGGSISASSQGGVDTGVGATFTNAGTFNKSGAGTTTVSVTFNNNGALNVQAGTLNFSDSFTHSGALTVASGATLSLSSGANTFNTSTTSIAGTLQLSSGTLQFTTPQTIGGTGTFQQSGGQVTSGDLTLASSLAATISFGAHTGSGTTTVQGATTISSSGLQLDGGRVFRNEGTVTQTGGVNLNANSFGTAQAGNGSVTNALGGTWNISGGSISASSQGGVDTGVGATFTNAGTFNKSGAGTTTVSVTFNNNGALNVQAGTLNFSDSFTHSGALTVASGATLSLSSGANTFNTSTTSIAGTLQLSSGTLQFTTPQTIGGTGTFQQSGGQVTSGDLTLASSLAATISFGAHTGGGTTTVQGATTISSSGLQLDGGRVFRNEGTVTQTGGVNLNANSFGTAQAGNGSVTNALGGTWNISGGSISASSQGGVDTGVGATFTNAGTFNKSGAGNTTVSVAFNNGGATAANAGTLTFSGAVTNLSGGTFQALGGGTVNFASGGNVTNLAANTLAGGIWRADSTNGLGTALLDFQATNTTIATNAADIYLVGADSVIRGRNTVSAITTLDQSLVTNSGSLRLQQGRTFNASANSGNFTNTGLLEVSDSTFSSNTLASNGTILGFGNSTVTTAVGNRITGNGAIEAVSGTLALTRGVNMTAVASLTSQAGATVNLSNATQASQTGNLTNAGSLDLGAQNIVVLQDYSNASFGVGNAFNARANVTGAGLIIGNNAALALTGDVSSTGVNTYLLDFGAVRGGSSRTLDFSIANTGTGASVRGALQTAANGANITDTRLTGAGVTAANFGPIAAGGSSGALSVTFNGTTGGSLTGQNIVLASNFDNVAPLTLNFTGNTTALAQGNATPAGNVNLGNFRVGGGVGQGFTVQNLTTGSNAERLGIGSVATTGNFAATNNLGAGFINPGASLAGAVSAATNAGVAGVNTGSLTINYVSNGQLFDASYTNIAANTQLINLQATGFVVAQPTSIAPNPVVLANQRVGGTLTQALTIGNTNVAPAGFQEGLDASLGATTGNAITTGSTAIVNLAQGGTNSTSLRIGVDTSAAGARFGSATVNLASNGTISGLANLALPGQTVNVSGSVFQIAQPTAVAPNPVVLANQRVGGTLTQALTISNTSNAPGGFQEGLDASFGASTGNAITTGSTAITNLVQGGTNSTSLRIGVDTSTAGARAGSATLNLVSNGTISGLADLALAPQVVNVSGNVYQVAQPTFGSTTINLGNVRVGGSAQQALSVTNTNVAPGFQEGLTASIGGASAGLTASGSFTNLAAGASNNASLLVGLDTAAAGARSGTATVNLTTTGAGTSGLADLALAPQVINVSGNVYQVAAGLINTAPLNFGTVQVGQNVSQVLSISNIATGALGFVEDLNASFGASSGQGAGQILGSGSIAGLLAGSTNSSNMVVSVNTGTAGTINGSILVNFFSAGAVNGVSNGLGVLAVGSSGYGVQGIIEGQATVIDQAVPVINTPTLALGNVRVGGASPTQFVSVTNQATGNQQAALNASISASAPLTAAGSFNLLNPGQTNANSLQVGMNTATAGSRNGVATVAFQSDASNIGGCAPNCVLNLPSQDVNITGAVYQVAQPTVPLTVNLGNVHVGGSLSQAITIGNTNVAPGFQEGLDVAVGGTTGGATGSGSISNLAAGGSSNAISVGLAGIGAGNQSGTVGLNLASNGLGTSGLATLGLPSQTVTVNAVGYNLAQASVTPAPVVMGNQRIGGTATQALTVANLAPNSAFTETLSASFGANGGNAVNNGGSVSGIAGGGSNNAALTVGVNTSVAGARSGTVTVNLASNEVNGSGLGTTSLGTQVINVSGNVYQVAAGLVNTAPLNFGTVQVGQNVSQVLSISNIATGALGFVEDLNASFGASSGQGAGQILGSGSINGLLAGGTNSSNMVVSVNTGTAGTINGSILVNFFSAGAVNGVSNGLGVLAVGSSGYGVQGIIEGQATVIDQAVPVINTPTLALGNVRVGGASPTQFVSVTNQATGNQQAALNASISASAPLTAAGSFNLLNPGQTNANSLQVGMNTATAGSRNGVATVAFQSDASNIGGCAPNCVLNLPSQDVNITGAVYQVAQPDFAATSINVAAARVGGTAQQALNVSNTNVAPGFQEGLSASIGGASSGVTAAGSFTNVAAGGSNGTSLVVGLDTATAGAKNGTAIVSLTSTGAGTSGLTDLSLGTQTISIAGNVYAPAVAQLNTVNVDFGIVRVGDSISARNVSVTNAALVQGLNDTLRASFGSVSSPFSGAGVASSIAAGASNAPASLQVGLNTTNAGVFSGSAAIDFASQNPEMADLGLGSQLVALTGQVNNLANPTYALVSGSGSLTVTDTLFVLDLGTLLLGAEVETQLRLTNSVFGPADDLRGAFGFVGPLDFEYTGWNAFDGLGAGQSLFGLGLSFDALSLGVFEDLILLDAFSYNASDPNGILLGRSLIVRANVVEGLPVPEPGTLGLLIAAGLLMIWIRRGSWSATRRGVRC